MKRGIEPRAPSAPGVAAADDRRTPGSLPPEKVEDRENVGMVRPEQYPREGSVTGDPGADNRGHRRSGGSGPVSGSGAGAGGKGNPEDYDSDAPGGDGRVSSPADHGPRTGADAPIGGSR
jgi:hypothetical protein